MRTAIFRLAAICALMAGALTCGAAASADNTNPNGAQVINVTNQCNTIPDNGITICITERLVFTNDLENPTANPAGYTNYTANGYLCYTETDRNGTVFSQGCQNNIHEHSLVSQDGTTQELHVSYTQTRTTGNGSCFTENFQVANGQLVYGSSVPC